MTDAAALERFEALVLGQAAASVPWTPPIGVDYSFEARKVIEGKHPQLIKDVFQPTRVLDFGCGPDARLARLLSDIGVTVEGYDPQRIEGQFWSTVNTAYFDLVIYREVNEHLTVRQMARVVRQVCALSTRFVYGTTRFHPSPSHMLDVATSDDLDPTHISLVTQPFLRMLCVLEGFARRADLEARMDWKQLGRVLVYERVDVA